MDSPDENTDTKPSSLTEFGESTEDSPESTSSDSSEVTDSLPSPSAFRESLEQNLPVSILDTATHPDSDTHFLPPSDYLGPSSVAQFFNLEQCPQYFKYEFEDDISDAESSRKDWREAFQPLSGLLAKEGNQFESEIVDEISQGEADVVSLADDATAIDTDLETETATTKDSDSGTEPSELVAPDNDVLIDALCNVLEEPDADLPVVLTQTSLTGYIGTWPVHGDADLLYIWFDTETNDFRIRIVDVKAGHDEKPYHQIQVAMYTILVRKFLDAVWPDDANIGFHLEGGVSHQGSDEAVTGTPSELPEFELWPRENDVTRLLSPGSVFDSFDAKDEEDVLYQLDSKCTQCTYEEACYTNAVEDRSPALLGITRSQQRRLLNLDAIDTISDIAELAYIPDEENARPYLHDTLTFRSSKMDTVQKLRSDLGLGPQLAELVQRSQTMVQLIDPSARGYSPDGVPWLIGTGSCDLPDDDPAPGFDMPGEVEPSETMPPGAEAQEIEMGRPQRGELIRVYLHVQEDFRNQNVAMVSGYVTASKYENNNTPIQFSHLISDIPERAADDDTEYERKLLRDAYADVQDSVSTIQDALGRDNAFVHFYVYGQHDLSALHESLGEYRDDEQLSEFQDLLLLSGDIDSEDDQAMVSSVQREITTHVSLPAPNTGLLPVMNMLPTRDFTAHDWKYDRDDTGETHDLRGAFWQKMFDFKVPYTTNQTDITLTHGDHDNAAGRYPGRIRPYAQIPLEYVWCAVGRIDADWVADLDPNGAGRKINGFRYHSMSDREVEINETDVKALGESLAKGVMAVERSLTYRDTFINKAPIDIENPPGIGTGGAEFANALVEFLDMEHNAQRDDIHSLYSLPVLQRVRTGRSIPVAICDDPALVDENEYVFEGVLAYDAFFDDASSIAARSRVKGGDSSSTGSWMVMNEIEYDADGNAQQVNYNAGSGAEYMSPEDMEKNVPVTIDRIDWNAGEENRGRIQFRHMDFFSKAGNNYDHTRRTVTTDPGQESWRNQLVQYGDYFVLDPQTDDINSQKARDMLSDGAARHNPMYQLFTRLLNGEDLRTDRFSDDHISDSLDWMDSYLGREDTDGHPPNTHQRNFIEESDHQMSLLQGPPGTGKTSGALSKAVLTRAVSLERDQIPSAGLVTGKSHPSIDEVLADTAKVIHQYREDPDTDNLDDLQVVRLGGTEPDDTHDEYEALTAEVTYIDRYSSDPENEELLHSLYASITDSRADGQTSIESQNLILFTTPGQFHGMMKDYAKGLYSDSDGNIIQPDELVEKPDQHYFDYVAIDEASMMNVPESIVAGSFIKPDAQMFVCGDQRQMPPIIQHDWNSESRWSVAELAPHLSLLDYLRFLRGDDVDGVNDDIVVESPEAGIAMSQLQWTYRCNPTVAEFLNKHHYSQDNITYESKVNNIMDAPDVNQGTAVGTALTPEKPLVLIKHNESSSQQLNATEAAITKALMEGLTEQQQEDVGVVVPHNAQKAYLTKEASDAVEIDTVERFQGGERSFITVSATASDPDFVKAEQDFLLNPNRLNVAMSRMQEKLCLIGSESVFDMVPDNTDTYEQAMLWKALYEEADVLNMDPAWSGTVTEFTDEVGVDSDFPCRGGSEMEVYLLDADDIEPRTG